MDRTRFSYTGIEGRVDAPTFYISHQTKLGPLTGQNIIKRISNCANFLFRTQDAFENLSDGSILIGLSPLIRLVAKDCGDHVAFGMLPKTVQQVRDEMEALMNSVDTMQYLAPSLFDELCDARYKAHRANYIGAVNTGMYGMTLTLSQLAPLQYQTSTGLETLPDEDLKGYDFFALSQK
jgi:hypothetical protein